MIYSYPDYYDKFHCIADKCPDTCCSSWQIVVDEDSLDHYENYEGEYRDTLHKNIDWAEGTFKHNRKGKCAFLRDDLLCDMYHHMGKESLCTTCREYPRHTEEFENVREISLSLSCPEVARMLMNSTDIVTWKIRSDEEEEIFEEFDYFLFTNLEDIREEMIHILQNRDISIHDRFSKVLQIGTSAQRHFDEGELISWDDVEEQDKVVVENEYELLKMQFSFLSEELEILYEDWNKVLVESEVFLFGDDEQNFFRNKTEFEIWWEKSTLPTMEIVLEQIVVYFLSIYLLGAVYDENIIGKVEACVGHGMEIYMLLLARWLKNEKHLTKEDLVELVYRYSREIEHSDENLEQVEVLNWFLR